MPFGNYGELIDNQDEPISFIDAVKGFNQSLGFDQNTLVKLIAELLKVTDNFSDRVELLERLPAENKKNLIQIHMYIRNKLSEI
jgi:hypothetical protein